MIRPADLGESPFARSRRVKELINDGCIALGGNRKLKIYGTISCASGKRMKVSNRIFFRDDTEAISAGYRPCGHCMRREYLIWKALNSGSSALSK